MTTTTAERSPHVELRHGLNLSSAEVVALTSHNSSAKPEDVWREALMEWRAYAIMQARAELFAMTPDALAPSSIATVMETVWQLFFPRFLAATGPMIAEAYIKGFAQVRRDEVPIQMIYRLAEEHSDRVGRYFNETSTEAMVQGFNSYVNRQVPKRAAIERVLEAYGLTPRQMSGYVSSDQLNPTKTFSATPVSLKAKIRRYVSKSISDRLGVFQRQERHNLDEQAKQVAWMWMVGHEKIPAHAEKMWLTAKDEKVCPQCGPMNGKKVNVTEKFKLPNGDKLFVPGAHVNCRCQTRLQINMFADIAKADDDWNPREHPRGGDPKNKGRFSRKPEQDVATQERSAIIEEMLRGVREVQEAEAKEPAIELAPKLTPPTQLTPPAPVRSLLTPPPAPPEPAAELSPPVPVVETPKAEAPKLTPPKLTPPSLTPPTPQKTTLTPLTPPATQLQPELDYTSLVEALDERQTAHQVHELEVITHSPTRQITDPAGNQVTGWVIADSESVSGADTASLNHDDEVRLLTTWNRHSYIADETTGIYQSRFRDYYLHLTGGSDYVDVTDAHIGPDMEEVASYGAIPAETVADAMQMAAKYEKDDPRLREFATSIAFTDMDDNEVGENEMTWEDLINYLGIDPEKYLPVVMKIDNGYGDAYPESDEIWKAPGKYTLVNETRKTTTDRAGAEVPYREVTLRPQVRETTKYEWRNLFPNDQPPS